MDYLRMMRQFRFCFILVAVLSFLVQPVVAKDASGGIGAQVVPISTGELAVLHVIAGSPAEQAGLLPGDLIIEVAGQPLQGSDFEVVTNQYLWGKAGTDLTLVWLRPGVTGSMQVEITRVDMSNNLKVKPTPGVTITTPE